MAYKKAATLAHAGRKPWPALQQGEGPHVPFKSNAEVGPQGKTTEAGESLPVLDDERKWPPAIWEMLESDSYRVAFVRIGERERLAAPHDSTFLKEVSAALLPFS